MTKETEIIYIKKEPIGNSGVQMYNDLKEKFTISTQ